MRVSTSLLLGIVAALLVSCGTTQIDLGPEPKPVACFKGNCVVPVSVLDCAAGSFSTPNFKVNLGGPGNGRTRLILWVLATPEYRFKNPGGLDVKDAGSFFGSPAYLVDGTVMTSQVTVTTKGRPHGYGLLIENLDGTRCVEYDPWVIE